VRASVARTELGNIILLGQVEELSDSGSPLGTQSLGQGNIGQSGQVLLSLLDNDDGEDSNVVSDNATSDRLPSQLPILDRLSGSTDLSLSLSGSSSSVARVAVGKEESDSVLGEHTLLHGETLRTSTPCSDDISCAVD
jgi:hypothetical protein